MRKMKFSEAIDDAIAQAMAADSRIIILGEDVQALRRNLLVRFGKKRVLNTPISEAAFTGAGITAAMTGLRPVVEIMLVDFIGTAMDAILNHAAKVEAFSGGRWKVPLVIRATCGGGYGDGGQHEQSLWGWLAHIPGISVVVPSTPADAGGLMFSALEHPHPVFFLEHKLLSDMWLDYLGGASRKSVDFDVPFEGTYGQVPSKWTKIPLGQAAVRKTGTNLTIVSLGVGVHRSLECSKILQDNNISAEIIDLRTVSPLDIRTIHESVSKTGCLLVVDEDYQGFGLSGEVAATLLERGLSFEYARVCTSGTIPFSRKLEDEALPNVKRILDASLKLVNKKV
ncbi:MAG: pyruvate dehydrogenase [Calditrichaeota bacterium]|nr:pyruvate dehydrogenase [Calditrichota bacterium]RQW02737.1 MAG: pyruvate dehydrogenase [Calditrichota bacterium]